MNNNQRDPRWAEIGLGDGSTTIGASGCTVSAIGDVLGVTPDVVNEKLKAVKGFSGAEVIWEKIPEAFPGTTINRVWSYDNTDVLNHVPNVIVEVPAAPIGGNGKHWVNYIGNHQLKDPWTGTVRPTSDFPNPTGYCVITPGQPQPQQVSVDSPTFEQLVSKSSKYDQFVHIGYSEAQQVTDKLNHEAQTIANLNATINDKNTQIASLQSANDSISGQLADAQSRYQTAQEQAVKVPNLQEQLDQALKDPVSRLAGDRSGQADHEPEDCRTQQADHDADD